MISNTPPAKKQGWGRAKRAPPCFVFAGGGATAIANQFAEEMFEAQVDADAQKSIGSFLGRLLESGFSGVAKGLTKLSEKPK